jgi:phage terminase small subunit
MGRKVEPPSGLSSTALEVWHAETRSRSRSRARLTLLETALRCWDQAAAFRALREAQEVLIESKRSGVVHLNPLIRAEQDQLTLFARYARLLDLQFDPRRDGDREEPANVYMRRPR